MDPGDRPRCGAKKRQGEGTCKNVAGKGTDHVGTGPCRVHGGATWSHRRSAQKKEAEAAVRTFGLPVEIDPAEALLQEVHRTAGHVAWLAEQVAAIEPDALVWGTVKVKQGSTPLGSTDSTEQAASLSMWLQLYQAERKHLVACCAAALAAGVEERRVKLAEQQGATLAGVIRAVLDDLGLTQDQRALVAEVVPRHLRSVAG